MKVKQYVAIIILLPIFVVSCNIFRSKSEQNKRFCHDMVHVFSTIYNSRVDSTHDFYETLYAIKQGIEDARLIMKPWGDDSDLIRKKTADYRKWTN